MILILKRFQDSVYCITKIMMKLALRWFVAYRTVNSVAQVSKYSNQSLDKTIYSNL